MKSKQDVEVRQTRDGSPTLYSRKYDQTYHNPGGAIAESRHVFFEYSGLLDKLRKGAPATILETGFGTGLNLLLLADYWLTESHRQPISFYSIEANPISSATARHMDYASHLPHNNLSSLIPRILEESGVGMNTFEPFPQFRVHLFVGAFADFPSRHLEADHIFHDAFSPDVNPELWTGEAFKKLLGNSSRQAILTTYCAASKAKGALSWAGWSAAEADGALGKREMTVASPNKKKLERMQYKLINNERMAHRYEIDDFD